MDTVIADLLAAPGRPGSLDLLAGPAAGRPVLGVRLVEDLRVLSEVPPGSLAVLTGPASSRATAYLLDVAMRDVVAAGGAGLVLTGGAAPPVARTVQGIAERGRVALLHSDGVDLGGLVILLARVVEGGAAEAFARLTAALDGIVRSGGDAERMVAALNEALGVPIELRAPGPGERGEVARGREGEVTLAAPELGGHLGQAVAVSLRMAAEAIARAAGGAAEDTPIRSRMLLLSELLVSPEGQALRLLGRARGIGLPVDGWHIALRVEPVELQGPERYDLLDAAGRVALQSLRSAGGAQWNPARADDALLLIRTQTGDPGRDGLRSAVGDAERLLGELRGRFPAAGLRCGVGGAHRGPLGLRGSAREARTALARGGGRDRPVTAHDLAGLDRMLGEWYASDTAWASARELLAPIEALGAERAEPLLRTLQAYLDHQGSPARAAEELHLHRNAVTQRIRKAGRLLGVDLADPEQRLALQLACRALRI
ncbi:PucR family transcriptional regulator [Actinomadura sp. 6N118]|uniref:PucR family transcriptional regulator n=1 Tax=Actinomadura sp. 6N118 TaxID=3375151 RepID=UPI00379BBBBD